MLRAPPPLLAQAQALIISEGTTSMMPAAAMSRTLTMTVTMGNMMTTMSMTMGAGEGIVHLQLAVAVALLLHRSRLRSETAATVQTRAAALAAALAEARHRVADLRLTAAGLPIRSLLRAASLGRRAASPLGSRAAVLEQQALHQQQVQVRRIRPRRHRAAAAAAALTEACVPRKRRSPRFVSASGGWMPAPVELLAVLGAAQVLALLAALLRLAGCWGGDEARDARSALLVPSGFTVAKLPQYSVGSLHLFDC